MKMGLIRLSFCNVSRKVVVHTCVIDETVQTKKQ